jgi:hypothetical protein
MSLGRELGELMRQDEEELAGAEEEDSENEDVAPPSGNGDNGAAHQSATRRPASGNGFDGEKTAAPPSPIGENGGATATLFRWLRGQPMASQRNCKA